VSRELAFIKSIGRKDYITLKTSRKPILLSCCNSRNREIVGGSRKRPYVLSAPTGG
jgi:hypothetical protein